MILTRFQPVHAVVGNAPKVVSVMASCAAPQPRTFYGTGAPSGSTLLAGNGKYNAIGSGWVVGADLVAAGSGYAAGNVLTTSGGTGTAAQITVDAVDGSGAITEWHVSTVGVYTAYPTTNTVSVTGGGGSSATFSLAIPFPDSYFDNTTPTAPVLYACQTSGSNSGSVWAKVSGGSGVALQFFKIILDGGDYWRAFPWDGATVGIIAQNIIKPSKLMAGTNGITGETIDGTAQSYTYTAVIVGSVTGYYTRTVTIAGSDVEVDRPTPDPLVNDIIEGIQGSAFIVSIPRTILTAALVSGGTGGTYAVDDVLTVSGGSVTSGYSAATIKVTAVSAGKVTAASLLTAGNYDTAPSLSGVGVTGGGGTGATFDLTLAPAIYDQNRDQRDWAA